MPGMLLNIVAIPTASDTDPPVRPDVVIFSPRLMSDVR